MEETQFKPQFEKGPNIFSRMYQGIKNHKKTAATVVVGAAAGIAALVYSLGPKTDTTRVVPESKDSTSTIQKIDTTNQHLLVPPNVNPNNPRKLPPISIPGQGIVPPNYNKPDTTKNQTPLIPGIIIPKTPDSTYKKPDTTKTIPSITIPKTQDSAKPNVPDLTKKGTAPSAADITHSFITTKGDTITLAKNFKNITYDQYLKAAKQKGYTGIFELITGQKATPIDYHKGIKEIAMYGSGIPKNAMEIFAEDVNWERNHTQTRYQNNHLNDKAFEKNIKSVYNALQEKINSKAQETATAQPASPTTKSSKQNNTIDDTLKQSISPKSGLQKTVGASGLFQKYCAHRSIDNTIVDLNHNTASPYVVDFNVGMQEVANYYASALNNGSTHSQALAYATNEASLATIQTKTDAKRAIIYAYEQGSKVTLNRWDSKLVNADNVKASIAQYQTANNESKENKSQKEKQMQIIAALREEYGMNMSRTTLQKYLRA